MKILVLSDSHSAISFMRCCVEAVCPDAIVHLGDYFDDGQVLAEKTCGQLREVRDMEPWLALIFEGGVVVRADKQGFFRDGTACGQEEFLAFLREKCPNAQFPA